MKDDRRSTYSSKDFKSIINDKVMAGLAAFVEDGVFTPDGVDRAVNVLKSHMKRVRYFGCKRVDVFATAVLRNAAPDEPLAAWALRQGRRGNRAALRAGGHAAVRARRGTPRVRRRPLLHPARARHARRHRRRLHRAHPRRGRPRQ